MAIIKNIPSIVHIEITDIYSHTLIYELFEQTNQSIS